MSTIVLSPTGVVNYPQGGGHLWVYLQYVHGLRSLGCSLYWMERLYPTGDPAKDATLARTVKRRLSRYGLAGRVVLYTRNDRGEIEFLHGGEKRAAQIAREADLILNFDYKIAPQLLARF